MHRDLDSRYVASRSQINAQELYDSDTYNVGIGNWAL